MKNDKKRALILLVILAIVVAAVVIILCSRPADPTNDSSGATVVTTAAAAKTAWQKTGRTDRPDSVSYITYDTADALGVDASSLNPAAALVPAKGTAYVFAPVNGNGLADLAVVFVSSKGEVLSTISYADMQSLAGNKYGTDAAYEEAATYVLNLYLNATEKGTVAEGEAAGGTWYKFTAEQIDEMIK